MSYRARCAGRRYERERKARRCILAALAYYRGYIDSAFGPPFTEWSPTLAYQAELQERRNAWQVEIDKVAERMHAVMAQMGGVASDPHEPVMLRYAPATFTEPE